MILNLTQHPATPEQVAAGVVDPTPTRRERIVALLTFNTIPDRADIERRARHLAMEASLVHLARRAMIGGAPYLMAPLERALRERGVEPLYAFSVRESAETTGPDGAVRKVNMFRHAGFVPAA